MPACLVAVVAVMAFASSALAQASHAVSAFSYLGCSQVNISCFEPSPLLPAALDPEACEKCCLGYIYAAVFWDSCRCGNEIGSVTPVAENLCDKLCLGNPAYGYCGHECVGTDTANYLANVYVHMPSAPGSSASPSGASPVAAGAGQTLTTTIGFVWSTPALQNPAPISVSPPAANQSPYPASLLQPGETLVTELTLWPSAANSPAPQATGPPVAPSLTQPAAPASLGPQAQQPTTPASPQAPTSQQPGFSIAPSGQQTQQPAPPAGPQSLASQQPGAPLSPPPSQQSQQSAPPDGPQSPASQQPAPAAQPSSLPSQQPAPPSAPQVPASPGSGNAAPSPSQQSQPPAVFTGQPQQPGASAASGSQTSQAPTAPSSPNGPANQQPGAPVPPGQPSLQPESPQGPATQQPGSPAAPQAPVTQQPAAPVESPTSGPSQPVSPAGPNGPGVPQPGAPNSNFAPGQPGAPAATPNSATSILTPSTAPSDPGAGQTGPPGSPGPSASLGAPEIGPSATTDIGLSLLSLPSSVSNGTMSFLPPTSAIISNGPSPTGLADPADPNNASGPGGQDTPTINKSLAISVQVGRSRYCLMAHAIVMAALFIG